MTLASTSVISAYVDNTLTSTEKNYKKVKSLEKEIVAGTKVLVNYLRQFLGNNTTLRNIALQNLCDCGKIEFPSHKWEQGRIDDMVKQNLSFLENKTVD